MATIRVKPSANLWRVTKNSRTVSNHRKKSAATRKARRVANTGDQLVVQRSNGTVLKHVRVH